MFIFVGKSLYEYVERPITITLINDEILPSGNVYRGMDVDVDVLT
jgi:hypothetical protein